MKIAIPVHGSTIEDHFGQSEAFRIYTIGNENTVIDVVDFKAPIGCGCKSNLAGDLKQMNVSILLAGNMGPGAVNALNMHGIKVLRGCHGDADQTLRDFLSGKLTDSGDCCEHDHHANNENGHNCHHN